jgi:hypothetical protein
MAREGCISSRHGFRLKNQNVSGVVPLSGVGVCRESSCRGKNVERMRCWRCSGLLCQRLAPCWQCRARPCAFIWAAAAACAGSADDLVNMVHRSGMMAGMAHMDASRRAAQHCHNAAEGGVQEQGSCLQSTVYVVHLEVSARGLAQGMQLAGPTGAAPVCDHRVIGKSKRATNTPLLLEKRLQSTAGGSAWQNTAQQLLHTHGCPGAADRRAPAPA